MKTGDVGRLFGVSDATIRNWMKWFESFMSPKFGSHRVFSEDDLAVLGTIAKYSRDGLPFTMIREKLEAGERIPPDDLVNAGMVTRLVPEASVRSLVDSAQFRTELERTTRERDQLALTVNELQGKLTDLQTRLEDKDSRIADLMYRLGKAEGQLEALQKQIEDGK